jgi:arylformamidase
MTDANDPAWREARYNARAAVPDHPAIFARWAERSTATRAESGRRGRLDLAYGDGPNETLDLFSPGVAEAPLHMFLHGGYWQALDKKDFSFIAPPLVEAGIAVAIVNYALCPAVRVGDIVEQMRRALAWIWRDAATLGLDRDRIHLSGHSAGGQLVAMMMATDWPRHASDLPADLVKSGLSISGVFELEPLIGTSINAKLGLDADEARAASPIFVEPATAAPLVLAVGGRESSEFHRQSEAFGERWSAFGTPVRHVPLPGRNHMTACEALAEPDHDLFRAAVELASGGS